MPKNIDFVKSFSKEELAAILSKYCESQERCSVGCLFNGNCPESCHPLDWEKWLDEEYPYPWAVK